MLLSNRTYFILNYINAYCGILKKKYTINLFNLFKRKILSNAEDFICRDDYREFGLFRGCTNHKNL